MYVVVPHVTTLRYSVSASMDRSESAVSKRKREEESCAEASLRTTAHPFIASATFSGARRGYWFGRGRLGQGYYADTPAGRGASDGADAALVSGPGLMQARTPSCRACAPAPARTRALRLLLACAP